MYRTLKTAFSANRQTLQHLFDIRRMCGTIWNDCMQLARIITEFTVRGSTKAIFNLN